MSIVCQSELYNALYGARFPKEELYDRMHNSDDDMIREWADDVEWLMWALERLVLDDYYSDHPNAKAFNTEYHAERQRQGKLYAGEQYIDDETPSIRSILFND